MTTEITVSGQSLDGRLSLIEQIALGAETTAVDAERLAEAIGVDTSAIVWGTKYWTPGSAADQSSGVQEAFNAAAGKVLIAPGGDVFAKGILIPHVGVTVRGAGGSYSAAGLGTRFILPASANTFMFASEGYVSGVAWSNYGLDADSVCFDGAKSGQQTPAPLIVLRTSRSKLGRGVVVNGSLGAGVLLTNVAQNGFTSVAGFGGNSISGVISNCDGEGIHAQNGAGGGLADIYLSGCEIAHCGGGAIKKWSILIERGAGLVVDRVRSYGKGLGNLRVDACGLAQISCSHFESTNLTAEAGVSESVRLNCSAYSIVGYANNLHWTWKTDAAGAVWRHLKINGQNAQARVSHAGNLYHSQNLDLVGWEFTGQGRVSDCGTELYRCSEPVTPNANIRRAVYA